MKLAAKNCWYGQKITALWLNAGSYIRFFHKIANHITS